jgi:deoxyinosine 3'endonuclease (endonuclease V)
VRLSRQLIEYNDFDWVIQPSNSSQPPSDSKSWSSLFQSTPTAPKPPLKYIGGVDISFVKDSKIDACASVVILEYPSLQVVWEVYSMIKLTAPYIAGLLGFREVIFSNYR